MDWVSLHTHSTYSFMDGYGMPAAHVARVAGLGMSALALTEHGNVSSHVRLEKACKAAGGEVKPVYGAELYTGDTRPETRTRWKWHLGVLALDVQGYQNLMQIVTRSWEEDNFHYEPTVPGELLRDHAGGIAVLSGCTGSKLATDLVGGKGRAAHAPDLRAAEQTAGRFRDTFGDRYYLEVQAFPQLASSRSINPAYERISKRMGIPLVATCDVHYPFGRDNEMQVVLHAAGRGSKSADTQMQSWEYDVKLTYPKSDKALYKKLIGTGLSPSAARGAIESAATLAERCNVVLPHAERLRFPLPKEYRGRHGGANKLLWEWIKEGWRYRGFDSLSGRETREYDLRLERELGLITEKDMADFFLATSDVVRWAKGAGIAVGPARGSAAASLICYLLRITEVNPMRYPLMMLERFLDPSRPDLPDIDLDFDDERRDEIRMYLVHKYGEANVGNIGNFIRYRAKNSLVDVARVHGVPRSDVAKVNEFVTHRSDGDMRLDDTLADTFAAFPVAAGILKQHPELSLATRLEGNVKGLSTHAAGLVVGTRPLHEIAAMYTRDSGSGARKRNLKVLSGDKYDAEYLDLLKMDFLGLTTMGMISHALDLAGLDLDDLYRITDHDKKVMKAFKRGDVIGIFQFEGRATRIVNQRVQPEKFMDLADINALSRPGPLFSGTTSEYIKTRHGVVEPESFGAVIDEITKDTRGYVIYQEQIINIVRHYGGFDWTDANSIRRIIAKKLGEAAFNVNFGKFAEGAKRLHDADEATALRVWKMLTTAGTYAFNIAHSVSYAILAWWCMWLKVRYPLEFYTASLMKADKIEITRRLLADAEAHGIKTLPPDPVLSGVTWTLDRETGAIRAGFSQIPGIGVKMAPVIVTTREATGGFGSWDDLIRVKGVGPATLAKLKAWADRDDPFGVHYAARFIAEIKAAIMSGDLPGVPMPTITSEDMFDSDSGEAQMGAGGTGRVAVGKRGRKVVYCGVVRQRDYKDILEDQRARSGEEIDQIRKRIKMPNKTRFATLRTYDGGEEEVYLRLHRFNYDRFAAKVDAINVGTDAVIVAGVETSGFGAAILVDKLWVIEPDDEAAAEESGETEEEQDIA